MLFRSFAPRLRELAAAVDPSLALFTPRTLDALEADNEKFQAFVFRIILGVSTMALLLSLAGLYSVMSFTVSRRTREIGIRVALGSDRRRIVTSIFARPLRQAVLGVTLGALVTTWLVYMIYRDAMGLTHVALVTGYAVTMLGVCLLACVVPTRRALGIQPTEALRAE